MNAAEWNAILAPHVPWQDAYVAVEREARAYLVLTDAKLLSTTELADALYPPADMRGEAGIGARRRLFKALAALTNHGLQDCCTRAEPCKSRRGLRTVRPWLWHTPRVPISLTERDRKWLTLSAVKGDRFTLDGYLCEVVATPRKETTI